jgi:Na+-transporting NADH:ubiquinone oxidoreductase subunit C
MRGNAYTFGFMAVVCVGCALVVSTAATILRPYQLYAERIDNYKNVLLAAGLIDRNASLSNKEIEQAYDQAVAGKLVDAKGAVVAEETSLTPEDVHRVAKIPPGVPGYVPPERRTYPIYTVQRDGALDGYIVPVYGQGLWSTMYGYLALESDGRTIRNLVFYKEGETPGLGKEITKEWFQSQFQNKRFMGPDGTITFTVGRPGLESTDPTVVGGISGATITGRGVQNMIVDMMTLYRPYFEANVWKKG